jgi:hypothetical protein
MKLSRRERRKLEKQKKRQERKELRQLGLSRKDIKLYQALQAGAVSKEQKRIKKNLEKKINYKRLRSVGYTPEEAKRFQNASPETIQKLLTTLATPLPKEQIERNRKAYEERLKREEREKKKRKKERTLVIYWRDLIEFADEESVVNQRRIFRYMTEDALEESAKGLLNLTFGESPNALFGVDIVNDIDAARSFYRDNDLIIVYEGKGVNYRHLLVAVNTMLILLYDPQQKRQFMMDLINNLRHINPRNASRLYRLIR